MPQTIVFLTGDFDAGDLCSFLAKQRVESDLVWVQDLSTLAAAIDSHDMTSARLVSFCTGVIVPAAMLERFACGGYNIHPGPPTFPGRHPESWGVYLVPRCTEWLPGSMKARSSIANGLMYRPRPASVCLRKPLSRQPSTFYLPSMVALRALMPPCRRMAKFGRAANGAVPTWMQSLGSRPISTRSNSIVAAGHLLSFPVAP